MHPKQLENVLKLSADERYYYFIRKVADFETAWVAEISDRGTFLWPEKSFAEHFLHETRTNVDLRLISLKKLYQLLSPGQDPIQKLVVFPDLECRSRSVNESELQKDLKEECKQYE